MMVYQMSASRMVFLKPDLRKVMLFVLVPVVYVSFFFLFAPWVPSVSTMLPRQILEPIGILAWIFIMVTSIPFAATGAVFQAAGIDFFYTRGMIATAGIVIGALITTIWWYILSCAIILTYDKFKRMNDIPTPCTNKPHPLRA